MSSHVVVQVSDTHLSRSHAYFQDNWLAFVDEIEALGPDLVVHSGDLAFNAPDVDDDLAFAREQMDRLGCPWVAIPGNHDVGEPGENPRLGQPIDAERLASWSRHFGEDRFCKDIGEWRLVGIDSELLGSGLENEEAQWAFLDEALTTERPLGLFLHKPLFLGDASDAQPRGSCVHPEPRAQLLARLAAGGVRFVASGHLHGYHHSIHEGMDIVWSPGTAFVDPARRWPVPVRNRAGYLQWRFEGETFTHRFVEPALFANIDLTNWTRESGTTITLPPRPLVRNGPTRARP